MMIELNLIVATDKAILVVIGICEFTKKYFECSLYRVCLLQSLSTKLVGQLDLVKVFFFFFGPFDLI